MQQRAAAKTTSQRTKAPRQTVKTDRISRRANQRTPNHREAVKYAMMRTG